MAKVNVLLERLNTWLKINKLILNVDKTKFMVMNSRGSLYRNVKVSIDNQDIEQVSVMKYLGFLILNNLKMKPQVD